MKTTRSTKFGVALAIALIITVGGLFFYNQSRIQSFGNEDISTIWSTNIDGGLISGPAIGDLDGDAKLEVVIGGVSGIVYAYDAENGNLIWQKDIDQEIDKVPTLVDVNNDNCIDVIISASDNSLTALDGTDGSIIWSLRKQNIDVTGHLSDNHEQDYYTLEVTESEAVFLVTLECYGNDFDVYGKLDFQPTDSDYAWRGFESGDEDLTVEDVAEGTWHIMVKQYSGSGNYHLKIDVVYLGQSEDYTYQFSGSLSETDDTEMFELEVSPDTTAMRCVLSCGDSDFDLYGRLNAYPTTDIYDWRGFASGSEDITIEYPNAGTWYIMVHSYSGSGGFRLSITTTQTIDEGEVTSSILTDDISVVDLNSDSIPEIISGTESNRIEILSGLNGSLLQAYSLGVSPRSSTSVGDLNNDGILDLVNQIENYQVSALSGDDGDILWTYDVIFPMVGVPIIADINGDGLLEVLISLESGECQAITGNAGELLWETSVYHNTDSSVSVGDIDRDGRLEIISGQIDGKVIAYEGETGSVLWEYQSDGSILFDVTVADIDGDNDLDIIGSNDANQIFALNGKTGLEIWSIQTPSLVTGAIAVGDLDDDFLLELTFACESGQLFSVDLNNSGQRIYWQGQSGFPLFSKSYSQDVLDPDLDTLSSYSEELILSNPENYDSDGDTIRDGWEVSNGLSPTLTDSDFDDLQDIDELQTYGTDPTNFDSDNDRLSDYAEIIVHGTNPLNSDSDQDLLIDSDEILIFGSNPFEKDSDNDTIFDGTEVHEYGSHPMLLDSDFDGISDKEEIEVYHTWANNSDSDGDSISDFDEITIHGSDPNSADTDQDGANDYQELFELGTDPLNFDSDGDAAPDGWEVAYGFDPLDYNVPIQEMLLFNMPLFSIGIGVLFAMGVVIRVKRKDEQIPSHQDVIPQDKTHSTLADRRIHTYHAEDGLEKPWLIDGKDSLLREGDVHDFMQWLVHEERRIDELESMQEYKKALRLARLLLKYVHQEEALIMTGGPRTYSDAVRRLEGKINHLLVRM
ncbi:MAG: PQQ-binding-like beta-propeller repeat protein [Candidatus Lokiarchaeota archaeon]|nr:PQQ-binding-like beta-propeller repeat protein [Candidatus Lokiarchaeota archaeon]